MIPACRNPPGLAASLRAPRLRRSVASALLTTFLLSPYGLLAAPVADTTAPTGQRPTVTAVGSVPVVNIAAPSASGLSHNKYQSFNVPAPGVVLNNATAAAGSTLAGPLAANPNLGGTAARVILNEVTGSTASLLAGVLEVAGAPAKVIVANPNGITCDGCGFLNTPQVQLTTGRPWLDGSQLRFDVLDGTVAIGPGGLTALATRLDLVARRISVNGSVAAAELNLLAGRAQVDAETLERTDPGRRGGPAPANLPANAYLIDISQSLKAGTIRLLVAPDRYDDSRGIRARAALVAEEDFLAATLGGVELDSVSAGRNLAVASLRNGVSMNRAEAGETLQIVADRIYLADGDRWHAGGDIHLGTAPPRSDGLGRFSNWGAIVAGRDLVLALSAFETPFNHGTLSAGRDVLGMAPRIATVVPDPDGGPPVTHYSNPDVSFKLLPLLQAEASEQARQLLRTLGDTVRGQAFINNSGTDFPHGGLIEAGRDVHLAYFKNHDRGRIVAANDIHFWSIPNPGYLSPGLAARPGLAQAGRDLWLHDLPSRCNGWPCGDLAPVPLSADRFSAGRDVHIVPTAPTGIPGWEFANPYSITAARDIRVETGGHFINQNALAAGRDIDIRAARFTNTAGVTVTTRTSFGAPLYPGCRTDHGGSCTARDETHSLPGVVSATNQLTVTADIVANTGASLLAGGDLAIRTGEFTNGARILKADWTSGYYEEVRPDPGLHAIPGPGDGSPAPPAVIAPPTPPTYVFRTAGGSAPNIGEIPALIRAGGRFSVAGLAVTSDPGRGANPLAPSATPATPPPASRFVNTGSIGADTILIKAAEIRNGFDPVADYYRKTALPSASPLVLSTAVEGGQLLADSLLSLAGEKVVNTGYVASGDWLAIAADSLENVKRNAYYSEDRAVEGGTLHLRGDTVQPGGALAARKWAVDAQSVSSRSGEFIVLQESPAATREASSAFVSALATSLGEAYRFEAASDHLTATFEPKKQKKKKKGLGVIGAVIAVVVTIWTAGAASAALAELGAEAAGLSATEFAASGSVWASSGAANVAVSQGLGSLAGSAVSQLATTGTIDWQAAFRSGLTAGVTAGLTHAPVFEGQSLNQIAGVSDIGATGAKLAAFNFDRFGSNLLAMAGRGVVTAGVATAINGGSFEAAFRNSVVSDLGAVGANAVGQKWGDGQNPLAQTLAHAAVGCATAAGQGKDCAAGAVGGASESVLGNLVDAAGGFDKTSLANQALYTGGAALLGGLLTEAAGKDGLTGLAAAQNAALNNYLASWQRDKANQELADCRGSLACQLQVKGRWMAQSLQQDAAYISGMGLGVALEAGEILAALPHLPAAVQSVLGNPELVAQLPAAYVRQLGNTYREYTTALESAGMDGATAAGRYYVKLVALLAAVPAGVEGAVKLPSTLASLTERATAGMEKVLAGTASENKLTNYYYRDGGVADPGKPMSATGPWPSVAELTPADANRLIQKSLPPGAKVTGVSDANAINAQAIADGFQAPFIPGTQVVDIMTGQSSGFVRVYVEPPGASLRVGSWVMRAEDIAGLTPAQIASKFSLPQVPTMVTDVTVPAGTKLQVSSANGISPNGAKGLLTGDNAGGGGVQFQIRIPKDEPVPANWFSNARPL